MTTGFVKWPSIKKFSDVYQMATRNHVMNVTLRGKIKLHGTNSAIRVTDGQLIGQKRTSDVSLEDDNAGFARWLDGVEYFGGLTENGVIFHGEWAGPGVQKGDAVAQLDSKKFFVFAVTSNTMEERIVEPDEIQHLVTVAFGDQPDIIVLPWYTEEVVVNFMDQANAQEFITNATKVVDDVIAVEDPYIKETFGVSGTGEGIVYYALDCDPQYWREYLFKVKTEAHSVNKSKKRDHVAPEKPAGIDEFIAMFFTEQRFNQMLTEHCNGEANRKDTGNFIKAVMQDVHKESANELELADFEWKDVAKYGVVNVRKWFFEQADVL